MSNPNIGGSKLKYKVLRVSTINEKLSHSGSISDRLGPLSPISPISPPVEERKEV